MGGKNFTIKDKNDLNEQHEHSVLMEKYAYMHANETFANAVHFINAVCLI